MAGYFVLFSQESTLFYTSSKLLSLKQSKRKIKKTTLGWEHIPE